MPQPTRTSCLLGASYETLNMNPNSGLWMVGARANLLAAAATCADGLRDVHDLLGTRALSNFLGCWDACTALCVWKYTAGMNLRIMII